MPIDRRTFVAGLAAMAARPAFAWRRPTTAYRRLCPPVRYSLAARDFLETRRIIAASDWRYQTVDPASEDMRGVLRHLPTGFAYLTAPDERPNDPLCPMHKAYFLFAEGEAITDRLGERRAIARAASYIAPIAEIVGGGSFYIPRNYGDLDVSEIDARPFIAAQTPTGFVLHV